ncbi:hypothetical protein [Nocardiopsis rhodophaea]|uniref:hypothetical protein n=1 Tax=Nocardiopsis rhodophaea TaxID=280238 RepID=UPI0031DEA35A
MLATVLGAALLLVSLFAAPPPLPDVVPRVAVDVSVSSAPSAVSGGGDEEPARGLRSVACLAP